MYLYSERQDARFTTTDPTLRKTQWLQTYNHNLHDDIRPAMTIHHMEQTVSYPSGAPGDRRMHNGYRRTRSARKRSCVSFPAAHPRARDTRRLRPTADCQPPSSAASPIGCARRQDPPLSLPQDSAAEHTEAHQQPLAQHHPQQCGDVRCGKGGQQRPPPMRPPRPRAGRRSREAAAVVSAHAAPTRSRARPALAVGSTSPRTQRQGERRQPPRVWSVRAAAPPCCRVPPDDNRNRLGQRPSPRGGLAAHVGS